jgi:hypothetical protein
VKVGIDDSLAGALDSESGWWFKLVSQEFRFLVDRFGYKVGGAYPHFRGSILVHIGSRYAVVHSYSQEERRLDCLIIGPRREPSDENVPVWRILQQRDSSTNWQPPDPSLPLTRRVVGAAIRRWARGLETLAGDILQGADIPGRIQRSDEWH